MHRCFECSVLRGAGGLQRLVLRDLVKPPPRDQLFKIATKFRLFQFLVIRAAGNAVRPFNA